MNILLGIVFAGYFLSLVCYFVSFEIQKDFPVKSLRALVGGTLAAHFSLILVSYFRAPGGAGLSFAEGIYVFSFLMVFLSFALEVRYRARFLMLFSLPIVLLFCLIAFGSSRHDEATALLLDTWQLKIHTGLMVVAFASLLAAASGALMYLIQATQLKTKHLGNVFLKLPPLVTIDRLHFAALFWGVVLFSLGILSGILSAGSTLQLKNVLADPKVMFSFLACVLYWIILGFRFSALRRGQKIAAGTVLAFALLFLTLLSGADAPGGFH